MEPVRANQDGVDRNASIVSDESGKFDPSIDATRLE